ncbi:hypothetical protein [Mycoplasma bradburyae]|uniref:Haemagglutinin Mycoplasma domain-containing protein n=1 Tax=Mycoplasma bradburyae TaxID=2963128 RepID=A0ABT5GBG0_9MOLU|nr:hypothetical protein [Mycoplasma bradburyae]MDC4181755.1 hypothetical protein [Mycoplasma bradburyae]UTS69809.1 hypothetical protein NMG68_02165 [Mycoplasma bradburyae]
MKQKTKKLLQLSFSLGFLATTALVATSCKQPATVAPKPTNPMQPGNGSGSETTTPGSGETMQPGNNSGSGTGTTTPDNTEAKNQLKALIDKENSNVDLYTDYSMIKSALVAAYTEAKTVSQKVNATKDELTTAKTALETAINKASIDKSEFDKLNSDLVTAYTTLKDKVKSKDATLELLNNDEYAPLKAYITNLYDKASPVFTATLQSNPKPDKANIEKITSDIENAIKNIEIEKTNVAEYSKFKLFKIEEANFKGSNLYSTSSPSTQSLVAYSQDFNNGESGKQWKYAKRIVKEDVDNSDQLTDVRWIYNLNSQTTADNTTPASYEVSFTYYGGSNATLYFPYKLIKEEDKSKLSLKYKLNDNTINDVDVSQAKVDEISVAKIDLTDLNFGENKIAFSTEMGKAAPMIGNIYIASTNATYDVVYNNIFGNEVDNNNSDKITVNFVKGYGLANKAFNADEGTIIKKFNGRIVDSQDQNKDYYLIGYLGKALPHTTPQDAQINIRYYTFYVNAPKDGMYEISGLYNSHESGSNERGLTFWVGGYNVANDAGKIAKFKSPDTGDWTQSLKEFDKNQVISGSNSYLQLTKGLNKIVVSGKEQNREGPNLGNVTFTLKEQTSTGSTSR